MNASTKLAALAAAFAMLVTPLSDATAQSRPHSIIGILLTGRFILQLPWDMGMERELLWDMDMARAGGTGLMRAGGIILA